MGAGGWVGMGGRKKDLEEEVGREDESSANCGEKGKTRLCVRKLETESIAGKPRLAKINGVGKRDVGGVICVRVASCAG
ncbi:hypothetical protein HZH66_009277 [Vespula vulgaris]|uniref:Uncharacterized protein n=1 Tax=Vespula vulgaris TaxID=7454 RepID=A0A834MZF4_VESVU|nr:hypothetical protein HZH66_009277 [Vespula vulgaris]